MMKTSGEWTATPESRCSEGPLESEGMATISSTTDFAMKWLQFKKPERRAMILWPLAREDEEKDNKSHKSAKNEDLLEMSDERTREREKGKRETRDREIETRNKEEKD
ncbi:hypothetical protein LOK49_LG13G00099 [Camellia lanceoleosa]|uniref:Uncharacterized protein n=1 Tax=Camellia lanceoleosa TaxID=1840588 RepID=A0ACC0FIB4_9ERIC|nr:hypothetical protein LOK49_LG13G00099 [Camellia lanceoleosa]